MRPSTSLALVTLSSLILLPSCRGEAKPVHDDRCGCTFTPAKMLSADADVAEEAILGYGNDFARLYASVDALPYAEAEPVSLASWLYIYTQLDPPERPLGKPRYIEVSGREGAMLESIFVLDGTDVHTRRVLVDSGSHLVMLQMWTTTEDWSRHGADIEAMTRSLELDPLKEPASYSGKVLRLDERSLLEARAEHETKVPNPEPATAPEQDEDPDAELRPPPDSGFQLIRYPAKPGPMRAFLSEDPGDGEKHPAVLWVEGGFGGPSPTLWTPGPINDDQSAAAFTRAGLVVMAPAFRGELGNPGRVEQWYGETEDLLAALEHLGTVPWVDPERIYLAGHSSGGTHVLLAAVAGGDFRAAFVLGGRADLSGVMKEGGYGEEVFDIHDETEVYLRSPAHWVRHLDRPVYYFEGGREYVSDAIDMAAQAKSAGKPMSTYLVPLGGHFDILSPVKSLIAAKILADVGAEPNFEFSEAQLFELMLATYPEILGPDGKPASPFELTD